MGGYVRRGERLGSEDVEQTIEFLRVFVYKCHHTKEEGHKDLKATLDWVYRCKVT